MSQRISELGLQDFERAARSQEPFPHGWGQLLAAEVRRLRGLIVAMRFDEPVDGVLSVSGVEGLIAEARAIREEPDKA